MIRILFGIIASLGLLTALGTVLARNLVHAALFLVAFFFLVACEFVLLEAEFMAAMQVLVYIGAVAIILMFGIMLTRNIQGDETTGGRWVMKVPAGIVAGALLVVLLLGITEQKSPAGRMNASGTREMSWSEAAVRPSSDLPANRNVRPDPRAVAISDMSRSVGTEMLGRYLIAFEVAGLLLTAALIGAVALAQSEETEIIPRTGASVDVRGRTTREPEEESAARGALPGGAVASAPIAKYAPGGDASRP